MTLLMTSLAIRMCPRLCDLRFFWRQLRLCLQAHAGKYKSDAGMKVEMNLSEGTLYATPSGQQRLRLIAMDEVTFRPIAFDGVTVRFNVADGKTIGFVLQDGTSATQLQRVND